MSALIPPNFIPTSSSILLDLEMTIMLRLHSLPLILNFSIIIKILYTIWNIHAKSHQLKSKGECPCQGRKLTLMGHCLYQSKSESVPTANKNQQWAFISESHVFPISLAGIIKRFHEWHFQYSKYVHCFART